MLLVWLARNANHMMSLDAGIKRAQGAIRAAETLARRGVKIRLP
jgi:hypothetical protein